MAEPQSSGYGLVGEKKIGNAGDTDVSVSILASSPTRARASSNALAAVDDGSLSKLPGNVGGALGKANGGDSSKPKSFLKTLMLIAAWYSSNLGVIMLNKALLSNYNYRFPIFLTFLHLVSCTVFSLITAKAGFVEKQDIKSRSQHLKIGVLAMLLCLSFVGGNISLRYIPVSFNQAIGATTPFFTAIAAYVFQRKVESTATYLSLVPVVVGIVIASNSEPSFHLFGFIICITSTAFRAIKSVTQGVLLSSEAEKMNSVNLLYYMAPIGAVMLFITSIIMEPAAIPVTLTRMQESSAFVSLLLINATLAYFVNLTNFLVTFYTSPLSLQVLGNGKGVVGVIMSILIFRNPVTVTGMFGYAITVAGVVCYGESKKHAASKSTSSASSSSALAAASGMKTHQRV